MKKERIIYTLIACALFTFLIGFFLPKPPSSALQGERFWTFKTHTKKKYDIVYVGDSRVYRGLSPDAMKRVFTKLDILNFAYSNGGLAEPMFEEATKKLKDNNSIIIIGITPASLTPGAAENEHLKQELRRKKTEVLKRVYINPHLRFFEAVKPISIIDSIRNKHTTNNYYETFTEFGFVGGRKDVYDINEAIESYIKHFKREQVSPEIIQNLMHQVNVWKNSGIKVYGFRPPTTEKMVELEDSMSGFEEHIFVKEFEQAGGNWLDIDVPDLRSYDGSHLDMESAERFSFELAKALKIYEN